ncbi:MAG: TonB-dependent receptor [Acidobacteria bacterium]|nr:TonB-dependent receptor [Acidobacteriota bacterium]
MRHQLLRVLFTLSAFLTITISAFAQADVSSATVKGTVIDPQGAAVANAVVNVKDLDQGAVRTGASDSNGEFQVRLVRPGLHDITVDAPGFAQYLLKDIQLTVGQTATFDIKLQVAGVKTEVVVTSSAPLIEIERTQQANTIESRQVENLPNVGRAFTSYVFTLPGVASSDAPRVQGGGRFTFGSSGFSIAGSNGRNNLVTLDGGENEYGSGQIRTNVSSEAIQEFQVNRNAFAAEFGFTAGTVVNVVTKSGTNNFHGSGYVFYRSQKTSARDPFDFSGKKSFDQQVFPGFTFGGPIAKSKLFFFTNYERLKSDAARFRSYTDKPQLQPSASQIALLDKLGDSTDGNVRRISANLRAALTTTEAAYPRTFQLLRSNEGSFNSPDRLNNWTTRIDYQISDRNSINGRFSLTRNVTDGIGNTNGQSPNRANTLIYRDYTTVGSWTHIFGPNLVNQVRAQFSPNNSALTVPVDPESASLIISGFASFGRLFSAPFNTIQDRYQFEDTLTWTKANHTLKFGGSYRPASYNVRNDLWFSGDWTFAPSAAFPITLAVPAADRPAFLAAVGGPGQLPAGSILTSLQNFNLNLPFTYRQGFNNPVWTDTAHYLGLFAQDTWKIHPRLTIDFGGRVDYDGEPQPIPHSAYFSPRFGFAWDVAGDHKTVIRGGGGVFVSPIYYQVAYVTNLLNDSGQFINQIFKTPLDGAQAPPALWGAGVALGKLPFKAISEADLNARGVQTGRGAPGRVIFQIDPNYENNYSAQANLGIQRQITGSLSVEITYLMSRGAHIQMPRQINYRESATPNSLGPAFGPRYERIDPTITQLNNYQSTGNSIYHGMTASLTKRFSGNFQFQINYTFSKAIDDQTDFNSAFAAAFPTRLNLERGLSSFDIRHNFVASGVFRSPFKSGAGQNIFSRIFADITLSPVVFIRSGIPFTLYTGTDTNGDTHANDRLIFIGRNTGIGPNFRSVNLRFNKSFRLRSDNSMRIEFITEASNLFNRTNFASVNDIIGQNLASPDYNAGTVRLEGRRDRGQTQPLGFTSAFAARQVQFGLKFVF